MAKPTSVVFYDLNSNMAEIKIICHASDEEYLPSVGDLVTFGEVTMRVSYREFEYSKEERNVNIFLGKE